MSGVFQSLMGRLHSVQNTLDKDCDVEELQHALKEIASILEATIIGNRHDAFNPADDYRAHFTQMLRQMPEDEQDEWGVIDLPKITKDGPHPTPPPADRPRRDMSMHSWPDENPSFWRTTYECSSSDDEAPALPGPSNAIEHESLDKWKKEHTEEVLDL